MLVEPTPTSIETWRDRLMWLTLIEAVVLLQRLGNFDKDRVITLISGFRPVLIIDLLQHFDSREYCVNIRPVYFDGGPIGVKRYKGTLLTVIMDRLLLISCEKGLDFALKQVRYAKLHQRAC